MMNTEAVSEVKLDDLDIMLIKQLELDARQSGPELARSLGSSPTTIRRRLQGLLDRGVVSIVAIPNPLAMGFGTRVFMGVNVRPGTFDEVASGLKSHRNVRVIIATTGRYDMLLSTAFKSRQQLFSFIDEELGCHPDVMDIEAMMILKLVKNSWMRVGSEAFAPQKALIYDIDDSELTLIRELELNPRASITDLGKKLGMSRISVRKRLQALMENNVIHVASVANLSAFGFTTQSSMLVKAKPGHINKVADSLADDTRIHHVGIISGRFNISAVATFQNSVEMSDFLRNKLGRIPGIMHHETMLHVGMPKQSFELASHDSSY